VKPADSKPDYLKRSEVLAWGPPLRQEAFFADGHPIRLLARWWKACLEVSAEAINWFGELSISASSPAAAIARRKSSQSWQSPSANSGSAE